MDQATAAITGAASNEDDDQDNTERSSLSAPPRPRVSKKKKKTTTTKKKSNTKDNTNINDDDDMKQEKRSARREAAAAAAAQVHTHERDATPSSVRKNSIEPSSEKISSHGQRHPSKDRPDPDVVAPNTTTTTTRTSTKKKKNRSSNKSTSLAPDAIVGTDNAIQKDTNRKSATAASASTAARFDSIHDNDAVPVVAPGAVAMRGAHVDEQAAFDVYNDDDDNNVVVSAPNSMRNQTLNASPIVAKAVVREDDVEEQVEDRFHQRADVLADHILQRLRQTVVVDAEMVEKMPPTTTMNEGDEATRTAAQKKKQKKKRKRCLWIAGSVTAAVLVVVVIIVVVLVTKKSSPSSPAASVASPTQAPAVTNPVTIPPTTTNNNNALPPKLQSNQSATLLQLVNGATSNHSLLAEYLNFDYNVELPRLLSSNDQQLTLFAPTDTSFQALQYPPYQFYFGDSWWRPHLFILLATHILTQNLTWTSLFSWSTQLPASVGTLNVDTIGRSIENGATIVQKDIQASNGYIQVPDRVILISAFRESLRDQVMNTSGYVFSDQITKFRSLLNQSGLQDVLARTDFPFGLTLFLPSDNAFDLLDENLKTYLFANPNSTFTRDLILNHMIDRNLYVYRNPTELTFLMLSKVTAWVTTINNQNETFINTAKVLNVYIAQNGLLHTVDRILIPPNLGPAQLGNLFEAKIDGYPDLGKVGDSNYLTVFAPLNHAFYNAINSQELLYLWLQQPTTWLLHLQNFALHHFTVTVFPDRNGDYTLTMLSGFNVTLHFSSDGDTSSNVTIDGIPFVEVPGTQYSEIFAENGLIYVIDDLLLPPWVDLSIYNLLKADTDLSTFASLVESSDFITSMLNTSTTDGGPWTLLAPNNAAFDALGTDTISSLTSNATLVRQLLNRHVISGNVYLDITTITATNISNVLAINNQTLNVTTVGNDTLIVDGSAKVLTPNILAQNGVMHVIDRVL